MLNLGQQLLLPQQTGEIVSYGNLYGSSPALILAQIASRKSAPLLVITKDNLTAQLLEQEIAFFLTDQQIPVLHFPDWETLPYDQFSPHHTIISQRIATLSQISSLSKGIIVTACTTILQRLGPPEYIMQNSFILKKHQSFNLSEVKDRCVHQGYHAVQQVIEPGEFSARGGIFDIFPMGSSHPFRIELDDDKVETIRIFDPDSQRAVSQIDEIDLLPAREFPLTDESITIFREQWRDNFSGNPADCPTYRDVSKGILSAGIEYYLPLFFSKTTSLFEYISKKSLLVLWEDCQQACEKFWQEISHRYDQYNISRGKPLLEPQKLYIRPSEIFQLIKQWPQLKLQQGSSKYQNFNFAKGQSVYVNHRLQNPLKNIQTYIKDHNDWKILICAESPGRRERLIELFIQHDIKLTPVESWANFINSDYEIAITVAPISQGLELVSSKVSIITELQLFPEYVAQKLSRQRKTQDLDNIIRNLAELNVGAAVVHIDYGVGRYLGLKSITDNDITNEYLILQYANEDTLYISVADLHLISRYGGLDGSNAPLDKLGSNRWQKAKQLALKQAEDIAANLLEIYAKREQKPGIALEFPEKDYLHFAADFRFEETPDQEQAINKIIEDMCSKKRMDRLVCGDVGFGKTEVAMRAAFLAVCNQQQVAILVPTTLLAEQHYTSFQDRFANWPVKIECLSRFRTSKTQQAIIADLASGKVDIVIGTHKLLQTEIQYHRLGLVIIDEEHRFGVKQKELFKKLRAEIDLLTLTATPIPRTLNMAMSQLRDLSIIATPPAKRLAVKTSIQEFNQHIIREAIMREILRGGQVFFLHNKVQTINKVARDLSRLVPEAHIEIAHGQMRERELEKIMSNFYHQRFNVLLCTTIIENGIDVPTANTIIIDQADHFGLAQLHQLRGRVGRSHHQAYAYLLTRPDELLTKDAKKRLEAFASIDALGAGFILATHDLEIRGAGEFLGAEQSGHIQTIGLSLYTELLNKAVNNLQSGNPTINDNEENTYTTVNIKISALIPNSFIADVHERLLLYKRISQAHDVGELNDLKSEMIDRFGLLPKPTLNLFLVTEIKLQAAQLGIAKLDANTRIAKINFKSTPNVNPMTIIQLIQTQPQRYQLVSANCLQIQWQTEYDHLLSEISKTLNLLAQKDTNL